MQYSSPSETRIKDRLERLEKHKLSDITDFLLTAKYAKAKDHQEEVAEFLAVLEECANEIFTVIHNRHAATPTAVIAAQAAPAQANRSPPKPRPSSSRTNFYMKHLWLLSVHGRSNFMRTMMLATLVLYPVRNSRRI